MRYGFALLSWCTRASRSPAFFGGLLGLLSWAWCSRFLMEWGTGLDATAALALAVVVAIATTLLPRTTVAAPWIWLALAGWTVAVPSLMAWTTTLPASLLNDQSRAFFSALTSALICLTPGLALVLAAVRERTERTNRELRRCLFGIGSAWCIAPLTLGAWLGSAVTAFTTAAVLLVLCARHWLTASPPATAAANSQDELQSSLPWPAATVCALAAGVFVATGFWTQTQLFLPTAALWCAGWGGVLIGVGLGVAGPGASLGRSARHCVLLGLVIACLAAALPAALHGAMSISGNVSWLPAIVGLRSLLLATFMCLPGLAIGTAAAGRSGSSTQPFLVTVCFAAGFLGAKLFDVTLLNALPFAVLTGTAGFCLWIASQKVTTAGSRFGWSAPVGGLAAALVAAFAAPRETLDTQRIVFSGPHFQARALGVPGNQLPAIDDGRLLETTTTSEGVTSVWAHAGVQRVLRENGITRGIVSLQPDVCPQPIPEVLTAVLPLTMHSQPHHILVTSAHVPTVAGTCLLFPVESVTTLDTNPAALRFCQESVERICPSLLQGDNRFAQHRADPICGLATIDGLYDVIIAPDSVVGDIHSARQWTIEHFGNIARHLAAEGIFCQRVSCFDLNVATVLDVARTAQAVFPSVQLNEIAPGEWLLIARTAEVPLDKSFLERLEKPHVRDVLAHAGWDWSIMLSLKTVHPNDLTALTSGRSPSVGRDGQIAYSLPLDVMQWGPKFEMRRQWIARNARPLGDALGEEPALTDVAQRLSDVTLAQQILLDHPDQFSAYRRHLKKRLQDRPRPKVIQVAGEGLKNGLDPEDSRRKIYFRALGKAVQTKSREDIDRLVEFYAPFDPLVTPFIPREFMHVDREAQVPDYAAQWRSGYRSVYFAPTNDASVNNVCDALEVLKAHPEVAGDAQQQWDCGNALLDVLKNRWSLRTATNAGLKYGVADAHRTLDCAAAMLEHMDGLRESAGIPEEDWRARRSVLEKHLIRSVRAWRTEESARVALQSAKEPSPAAIAAESDDSL